MFLYDKFGQIWNSIIKPDWTFTNIMNNQPRRPERTESGDHEFRENNPTMSEHYLTVNFPARHLAS